MIAFLGIAPRQLIVCLALLSLLSANHPISAASEPFRDATVWIRAGDRSSGTGFVIDREKRWILTAWHVVGDQSSVEVFFREPTFTDHHRDQYLRERNSLRQSGRCVTGKVISKKEPSDLALIELSSVPKEIEQLSVSKQDPAPGSECYCFGNRLDPGLLWLKTIGTIRQTGLLQSGYSSGGKKIGEGIRVNYAQMSIELGDSGAAVLNSNGEVVGLVSAIAGRCPGTAILIAGSEIRRFLGENWTNHLEPPKAIPEGSSSLASTVWIRPESTDSRFAGVVIKLSPGEFILTSATAVGSVERVDVIFPLSEKNNIVGEASRYEDRLDHYLKGFIRPAVVLKVDRDRDLAILQTTLIPSTVKLANVGTKSPKTGDKISAVSHPLGVELRWLHSTGSVRGSGSLALNSSVAEKAKEVDAVILQLPHQGNCSGGPVFESSGDLVGILSARESPRQESAFSPSLKEIRQFLGSTRQLLEPVTAEEILALAAKLDMIDPAAASQVIAKGAQRFPNHLQIRIEEIRRINQIASAKAALKNLQAKPATASDHAAIGRLLVSLGDLPLARQAFDKAVSLDANNLQAWLGRASIADGENIEKFLAKASQLDASSVGIHRVRASKLPRLTNDERRTVIDELTRILEFEEFDTSSRSDRAELWLAIREFKKAEADLRRLTEIQPATAEYWYRLARVRMMQFKNETLVTALRSAWRVDGRKRDRCLTLIVEYAEMLLQKDPKDEHAALDWIRQATKEAMIELEDKKRESILRIISDPKSTLKEKLDAMARFAPELNEPPAK